MRLVTYNIRLGVESSLEAIAHAIRDATPGATPDLVALQEVGDHWNMGEHTDQTGAIAAHLGLAHHTFAGALTDAQGGRYGIALMAPHAIEDIRVTPLPRDTDEQRVALTATLAAPTPIHVVTTHLSVAEPERITQAHRIGRLAAAAPGPVIVLGDLNDRPDTPTHAAARGALTDCFDHAGAGPAETFSVVDPHRRIDYIFVGGGLVPAACRVVREATASDHFPLVAWVAPRLPPT